MAEESVPAQLRVILAKWCGKPVETIRHQDHLVFDLRIDEDDVSFDLIPELEQIFMFQATRDEWGSVATVGDLEALVGRYAGQFRPEVAAERAAWRTTARRRGWIVGGSLIGLLLLGLVLYRVDRFALAVFLLVFLAVATLVYLVAAWQGYQARRAWRRRQRLSEGA